MPKAICYCSAYDEPHNSGAGHCPDTGYPEYLCGNCMMPCQGKVVGAGDEKDFVSGCCESEVLTNDPRQNVVTVHDYVADRGHE